MHTKTADASMVVSTLYVSNRIWSVSSFTLTETASNDFENTVGLAIFVNYIQ